jgi:mono/diheme cytochrome c family protein
LTEIPEHLLRRSRERRAALGLGGGDADTDAAPAASTPATTGTAAARPASSEVEPAAAAGRPAIIEEGPVLVPTYIAPRGPHKAKVPLWVMPVLVALPLWAALFPGAFGNHQKTTVTDPLVVGEQVFHTVGCSGCHGSNGEGGVGPPLHAGLAKLTFPNVADQTNWVKTGSGPFAGKKYGDPNRPGGQHGPATGGMPAFGSSLTPAQIDAVVQYERNKL